MPRGSKTVAADAQLGREWCIEGNGAVLPEAVALGSIKKRTGKCLRVLSHPAHQAKPNDRSNRGTSCPECAKEARRLNFTRRRTLAEEYPELAKQWDPTLNDCTPTSVTSGSGYMASWICLEPTCQHLHCWKARVCQRTTEKVGSGSPFCSGRMCCPFDSLAGKYPELLAEWDYGRNAAEGRDPENIGFGSHQLVWWKNDERGSWREKVYRIVRRERGRRKALQEKPESASS